MIKKEKYFDISGSEKSPIIHLRYKKNKDFDISRDIIIKVIKELRSCNIAVEFVQTPSNIPKAAKTSIKLMITAAHTEEHFENLVNNLLRICRCIKSK